MRALQQACLASHYRPLSTAGQIQPIPSGLPWLRVLPIAAREAAQAGGRRRIPRRKERAVASSAYAQRLAHGVAHHSLSACPRSVLLRKLGSKVAKSGVIPESTKGLRQAVSHNPARLRANMRTHPRPILAQPRGMTLPAVRSAPAQAQKARKPLRYGTRRDLRARLRGYSILPGMVRPGQPVWKSSEDWLQAWPLTSLSPQ